MILATVEEIPLTRKLKKLVEEEAVAELMIVVVEVLPLVVLVNTLAALDRVLVVEEATALVRSVVVDTPFMATVKLEPEVVTELEVMIELVEVIPFTVEVAILPPVVKE